MTDPFADDQAVLDALAEDGHDLSQPMPIDFFLLAPDEPAAHGMAEALRAESYVAEIEFDDGQEHDHGEDEPHGEECTPVWAVCVHIEMIPDVKEIVRLQVVLADLVAPFEGEGDGWGTVGNAPQEDEEDGDEDGDEEDRDASH